jgi:hypothetical protein
MNAIVEYSRTTQRTVCMVLAAVIVAGWLSLGALSAQSALHNAYAVTITQLSWFSLGMSVHRVGLSYAALGPIDVARYRQQVVVDPQRLPSGAELAYS